MSARRRVPGWAPDIRRPSPIFVLALFAFGLVLMLVAGLAQAAPEETRRAPVVAVTQTDGVLLQTGWFTYPKSDDAFVLYCVEQGESKLTCIVYTEVKGQQVIVLVPDIAVGDART